eukprot:280451_1
MIPTCQLCDLPIRNFLSTLGIPNSQLCSLSFGNNMDQSKIQDNLFYGLTIYGPHFYQGAARTDFNSTELMQLDAKSLGIIEWCWLPIISDDQIVVPVIWMGVQDGPYLIKIEEMLETHYQFFSTELKECKDEYEPREYKAITTALRTYKDNLQQKLSTCQFQKGFLVLLNGSTIPFANKHPVGKIQKIKKRDVNFPIEIIHMRANNDGTK